MEQTISNSKKTHPPSVKETILTNSKEKVFILVSTFFAFLIRFLLVPQNTVINGDGVYYATLGKKLVSGDFSGGISAYWSPLFSSLVGISSLFFQDVEFAGRIVSVITGAILIIPSFFLIKNLFDQQTAFWGTILLIFHPVLIKSSGWVMTESLYTLIFTTGILSTWYALCYGRAKDFFLTGLLFGMAYLTKPEAIGFLGLLFGLAVCAKILQKNISSWRYVSGYLLILVGFGVFFLPYIIFLHQKTGQWTISQKIMVNFPAADYEGSLLKLIKNNQTTMLDRIWGDNYENYDSQLVLTTPERKLPISPQPEVETSTLSSILILGEKAVFLLEKQFRDYIPILLPKLLVIFAIFGLFFNLLSKFGIIRSGFLFSFFICTAIGYALTAVEWRYLFPLVPILVCWVANGIVGISNGLAKLFSNILRTKQKISSMPFQICILLILIVSMLPLFLVLFSNDELQNVPFEEKQAGLWIRNNSDSSVIVLSSHATPAFYAGAKHLFIPDEDFPTVLNYIRNKKVNYLIFSQRRINNTPNAFPNVEQTLPQDMRIVYKDEQNSENKVTVYQILY